MPDSTLVCRDCGATFLFTEEEQEFYRAQGFTSLPRRCKPCRARNRKRHPDARRGPSRSAQGAQPHSPGPHAAGAPGAPADGQAEGDTRPPRRVHDGPTFDAVCTLCASPTQVPFQPDGVRPVYCLPCLKKQTR